MRGLLVCSLICLSAFVRSNGDDDAVMHVTSEFIFHFQDASIADVVLVTDKISSDISDKEVDDMRRLIRNWTVERDAELKISYRGVTLLSQDFEASTNAFNLNKESGHFRDDEYGISDNILYVIVDPADLLSIQIDETMLAANVWLIFSDDFHWIESQLGNFLTMESMVYVYGNGILYEWYRIGAQGTVVMQAFARFGETDRMNLLRSSYIWDRRSDLRGFEFKTAFVLSEPFIYLDKNGTLTGLMIELGAMLGSALNFSLAMEETDVYGDLLPNGSWTGIVGMLNTSRADITINDFSITDARSKVVDFSLGIYQQYAQLFMQLPKQSASWSTYIDVFHYTFWYMLIGSVAICTVILHLVFKLSSFQDPERSLIKSLASVLLTIGALSVSESARKPSTRSLFLTVCLFGAMVYWSFNAILVSLLTVDFFKLPINNFGQLLQKSGYQLILIHGDAFSQFFSLSNDDTVKQVFDAQIRGNPGAFVSSNKIAGEMMMADPKTVFFGESDGAKKNMAGYPCHIRSAGIAYYKNLVSFAFPKGSQFTRLFSAFILKLKQGGEVEKLLEKYLDVKGATSCSESSYTTIGYQNIFSAFVMLLSGIAVAWAIVAVEKYAVAHPSSKLTPPASRQSSSNSAA